MTTIDIDPAIARTGASNSAPRPTAPPPRARYLANITTIAAYREQHRVTRPGP